MRGLEKINGASGFSLRNDGFSLVEITELRDFDKLHDVWNCLADRQENYGPFMCHEWFKLWFEHFVDDSRLRIFLLYEQDTLKMIAPFILKRDKFRGIDVNKMELIGNVYSPIRSFLFSDTSLGAKLEQMQRLTAILREKCGLWDVIDLYGLPEEYAWTRLFVEAARRSGFASTTYFCYGNWYIDGIDYSAEDYLAQRPGNISKNIPYRKRRLGKIGNLEFKLVKEDCDLDHYMDIYYDLYSRSWQKEERFGPNFHRSFSKMAARNGWLRLGFLFLDGVPIACQLWLAAKGTAYIVKLFYDTSFQHYAPGKILTAELARYVIDEDRVDTIDYLHGDEPYKKDWTPKRREREGLLVFNDNVKGKYLAFLYNSIRPIVHQSKFLSRMRKVARTVLGRGTVESRRGE